MDSRLAVLTILCLMLSVSCRADITDAKLSNGYFSLDITGTGITRLQVDPAGKRPSGLDFVRNLWPEFWRPTAESAVIVKGHTATVSGMEVWEYRSISTNVGIDRADRLESGHTLGYTFCVPEDTQLSSVELRIPTWNTSTSSATLRLYRDGKLIVTRRIENVSDNSWQSITPDGPMCEGTYTVEMSDPTGDIGWWSSGTDTSSIGDALLDGKPVDADRAIQVHMNKSVGKGQIAVTLDRNALRVNAEFAPTAEMQYKTFPWRWKTTWTKDGYDCTPKSGTVFSRFFTDNQRYIPIQQLKRRDYGGVAFDGCKWIEMDGTRDADLRLASDGMHLHWEMRPDEMHLRLDTPLAREGDIVRSGFTLTADKRDDAVPDEFPHFACSDKALEADLNRFWWERGFSYGAPPNRCIEFSEWMSIMRAWYDGPQREGEVKHLADYPITDEGYVHTYGNIIGWPLVPNRDTRHFDTNARFILACWRHYMWSGDKDFLRSQADRLRKAMAYQLEVLKGRDGLIVTPDFKTGRHEDLSNNYWDILPFGHLDAYANAAFYGSLQAMAQIEQQLPPSTVIGRWLVPDRRVSNTPKGAGGEGAGHASRVVSHSPSYYRSLARKSHAAYDATFWLDDKGRYAGCVDSDGVVHDYGFTFVNLEALHYGLGDAEKAKRIYHWMETEPTSTGKVDTYTKWIFAPRANTIHNPQWKKAGNGSQPTTYQLTPNTGPVPGPWWTYWWPGTPYGDQCQDGGAILYTSFFDLMDRAKYLGADNAWKRFMEIMARYRMPDRLSGGSPLYRGEIPQQENAGSVGVDYPFAESGMVPLYVLYGVMGLEPTPDGLRITPRLPSALSYVEIKSLTWHGTELNIRVTQTTIEVRGTDRTGKAVSLKYAYKTGTGTIICAEDVM